MKLLVEQARRGAEGARRRSYGTEARWRDEIDPRERTRRASERERVRQLAFRASGGLRLDPAGSERQPESVLDGTLAHRSLGAERSFVQRLLVGFPVHLHAGKEVFGMTVPAPEAAEFGEHLRCDRHIAAESCSGQDETDPAQQEPKAEEPGRRRVNPCPPLHCGRAADRRQS